MNITMFNKFHGNCELFYLSFGFLHSNLCRKVTPSAEFNNYHKKLFEEIHLEIFHVQPHAP